MEDSMDPRLQEALDEILRLKEKVKKMEEEGGYGYWLRKAEEVREREKRVEEREKRIGMWEAMDKEGSVTESLLAECMPPPLPDPIAVYLETVSTHLRAVFDASDPAKTGYAPTPDLRISLRREPFFRRDFPNLTLLLRNIQQHPASKLTYTDLHAAVLHTLQHL